MMSQLEGLVQALKSRADDASVRHILVLSDNASVATLLAEALLARNANPLLVRNDISGSGDSAWAPFLAGQATLEESISRTAGQVALLDGAGSREFPAWAQGEVIRRLCDAFSSSALSFGYVVWDVGNVHDGATLALARIADAVVLLMPEDEGRLCESLCLWEAVVFQGKGRERLCVVLSGKNETDLFRGKMFLQVADDDGARRELLDGAMERALANFANRLVDDSHPQEF